MKAKAAIKENADALIAVQIIAVRHAKGQVFTNAKFAPDRDGQESIGFIFGIAREVLQNAKASLHFGFFAQQKTRVKISDDASAHRIAFIAPASG